MKNLQVQDITLAFADRQILDHVAFAMGERTRAALSGANGCGKSTLMKVLTGSMEADIREYSLSRDARMGYLPQSDIVLPDISVYSAAEEGYRRFDALIRKQEELEDIASKGGSDSMAAAERLSEIHDQLLESGYYDRKSRVETILFGLGFSSKDLERPCREFSGGYQMRVALARILIEDPDFLFLDEPTNYLDIEAMTWLEEYLKAFRGGLMLVSHDQAFLDDTVSEVYELFNGRLTRYAGNYTEYLKLRQAEIERLEKERKKQEEAIERTEEFIERFRYKATKSKQVQSRIKALDRMDLVEVPSHLRKLRFSFPPSPHSGNDVLKVDGLCKSYPGNAIYSGLSFMVKKGERLAITGRNGAGKSTLLRILAGVDPDYTGSVIDGAGVKKAYFAQENEETLNPVNTVLEEVESVADTKDIPNLRSMLGAFLFSDDDVFKKVSVLSGGERSRLSLLKILLHPSNLLLLDEPTNHLDINAKEMLLGAIREYGGTVVFVSHDKHFIKNLATRILYVSETGPEFFDGDYEYFERKLEEKEERFAIRKEEKQDNRKNLSYQDQKARKNRIRNLEREAESLLESIGKLERKRDELGLEMERPDVYSVSSRIKAVMDEKSAIEKEIEEKEERWMEITAILERDDE